MTVYVDDMEARFRAMKMCHMIADSTPELLEMADKIGIARKWIQHPGTHREHFDIPKYKRARAVKQGAREISMYDLGRILLQRRSKRRAAAGEMGAQSVAEGAGAQ